MLCVRCSIRGCARPCPRYVGDLTQTDGVHAFLARQVPSTSHVPSDACVEEIPLPDAVRRGAWRRTAADASAAIEAVHSAPMTAADVTHLLAWWHLRLVALGKLRLWEQHTDETKRLWRVLDTISIQPDGVPMGKTAVVPYPLSLLRAESELAHGDRRRGIARMWEHVRLCEERMHEDQRGVWRRRAVRTRVRLASALVDIDAYEAAAAAVQKIGDALLDHPLDATESYRALVLARLALRMGNTERATALVAAASADAAAQEDHAALVRVFSMQADEARDMPLNTAAVVAFYRGDFDHAVRLLEDALDADPHVFVTEPGLAGNLLTLHTMGTDG